MKDHLELERTESGSGSQLTLEANVRAVFDTDDMWGLLTCWEPMPVPVAWLVTAGDHEIVERVRKDLKARDLKAPQQMKEPSFHAPNALVRCLEFELRGAGLNLSSPRDQFPRVLANPCGGRFQPLVADFKRWRLQLPEQLLDEDEGRPRKYLQDRFNAACAEICEGIANDRIEAKGVLVDGAKEHPAGLIPASAITKDMKIGDDGLLYQGQYKRSPAWKLVEVRAKQRRLSATLDSFCPAPAEVKSKPGPDGDGAALQAARKAIGSRRPGEQKQTYRERLAGWIKAEGGTPPSAANTFRKYGC